MSGRLIERLREARDEYDRRAMASLINGVYDQRSADMRDLLVETLVKLEQHKA